MGPQNLQTELPKLRIDRSRKRSPRRRWGRLFLGLLILGGAAGAYQYYQNAHAAIPVKVVRAEREEAHAGGAQPVLTASGYVIPRRNIEVSSKIIGRVKEVLVDRGQQVRQGQPLVRLQDDEYQAQVQAAEAQYANAQAVLAQLRAGSRPEEIAAAHAAVASAEATFANSQRDLERFNGLYTRGVVSKQEFDQAQTAYDVAQANLKSAKENATLVEKGPRQEQIDAAEAQARAAKANLEYAKTQLSFTVIDAPTTGTILEKVAEVGELVTNVNFGGTRGAKASIVTMADLSDLLVEIDLNEGDLGKARVGQPCEIKLDSLPNRVFQGRVDEIAPQADRQKATVQVKVSILDPTSEVRPESSARVTFLEDAPAHTWQVTPSRPRVWIPPAALVNAPQGTLVYIASDGTAVSRPVKTGGESARGIEVLDGLAGNEMLIVEPLQKIKDGAKIKVMS
ncbi:MAG: efflux RND transporter periplasmic adaptor subunit [Candidatus Sumerlaeota bacterium]|nr:efflux RND transporter periplasmic adaptor subunit [Candidatus Sumerlaeota bacterium]